MKTATTKGSNMTNKLDQRTFQLNCNLDTELLRLNYRVTTCKLLFTYIYMPTVLKVLCNPFFSCFCEIRREIRTSTLQLQQLLALPPEIALTKLIKVVRRKGVRKFQSSIVNYSLMRDHTCWIIRSLWPLIKQQNSVQRNTTVLRCLNSFRNQQHLFGCNISQKIDHTIARMFKKISSKISCQ